MSKFEHKSSIESNSSEALKVCSHNEAAKNYSKLSSTVQGKYFKVLLSRVTVKPGNHCLDIGCGTGIVTAIVANK